MIQILNLRYVEWFRPWGLIRCMWKVDYFSKNVFNNTGLFVGLEKWSSIFAHIISCITNEVRQVFLIRPIFIPGGVGWIKVFIPFQKRLNCKWIIFNWSYSYQIYTMFCKCVKLLRIYPLRLHNSALVLNFCYTDLSHQLLKFSYKV